MKERPILFSGPMVRAILDGRKTQTRRMVKWPASYKDHEIADAVRALNRSSTKSIGRPGPCDGIRDRFRCPYGVVGDRIWCRETWCYVGPGSGSEMPFDVEEQAKPENQKASNCWYRADGEQVIRWTPSIHMPRWASRITLEIVSIRVERLQEITEEDARCEGVEPMHLDDLGQTWKTFKRGFQSIWDSIYGNWDANPRVWVVEFRRVQP